MISRTDLIASTEQTSNRMLGPSAYSEALLPSLRLARSSRIARRIGKLLLFLLIVGFIVVALAPWQQSVIGSGQVVALDPSQRPQPIEVAVKGRIAEWGENIRDNAPVKKGQVIAVVEDVDPNLMARLQDQLAQTESLVVASGVLRDAKIASRDAASRVIKSQEALLKTYERSKEQIVASAEAAIAGAKNKVEAAEKERDEVEAALTQIELDYERQKQLFEEDIVAGVKLQLAERKYLEAQAKVAKAKAYVQSALNDLEGKERDKDAKEQKAQGEIDYARALLDKANSEVAKADSEVAKAEAELNKAKKTLSEMQTKVSRQEQQKITAPFDGILTSIRANLRGQMVKEGDTLCVIVPDISNRAVEAWLDGNDALLVAEGRHVRLQFEGWPAVQFTGWAVSVGTFGGTIVSVDATDNGKGKFRVVVRPDGESDPWPEEKLKQGVRVNAWVLLEQVPLWYEIWRNMNGFPPEITPDEDGSKEKDKAKKPKLPK